jgi:hypothetical protein
VPGSRAGVQADLDGGWLRHVSSPVRGAECVLRIKSLEDCLLTGAGPESTTKRVEG